MLKFIMFIIEQRGNVRAVGKREVSG